MGGDMPDSSIDRNAVRRIKAAAALMLGWLALLWVLEAVDSSTGALQTYGLSPRDAGELRDVIPMAFLHHGFDHLAANALPLLVLGFLAALSGTGHFLRVVLTIMVVGGLGVWLTAADNSVTAGASGVVFGLLGYLLVRGFVNRRAVDIVVGLLVLVMYGSALWGVLPTNPTVSWQGHLFGLIGGVMAAFMYRRPKRRAPAGALIP
ncbi:rhomboid family intramembrane serine protease [Streptomyces camponoticapitis]|uniref:Rhomboid family intramembrane serine protease n=2 Tax=Streptomyces camponoticapitis TaxID=1616125 RepID=A0ABQ2E6X9_9ACTN|nr:rhomboid family intramembrane serine protease [Streptomyces camponoticapitis]